MPRSSRTRAVTAWLLPAGFALLLPAAADPAGVTNPARARINYMLNCQGCHGADGSGTGDAVPEMKNFVGNFLTVDGGREFLVRVPGSANSALDDASLAEVLNWMIPTLSPGQTPSDFDPYTAAEVGRLRALPLNNVADLRSRLIREIEQRPQTTPTGPANR